uniref:Uncharacterized protein n=1 Tax=viral metagenome TaxID=1070528 RepID=A0A6M3L3K0_9ZZZZ
MTAWTQASTGVVVKDWLPNLGFKIIHVKTPAGFINGTDTMAVDLTKYGARNIIGVIGFQETTAGSVTLMMAVSATTGGVAGLTTAVSSGTLTITTVLPANTCVTNFIIFAY